MNSKNIDIHERIFEFVILILQLIDKIPKTPINLIIINQLARSVTSMGANSQEADGTSSKKDFIHCLTIVRKEGKESLYWLRLIARINSNFKIESDKILNEGNQIVAIISSIIRKTMGK